MTTLFEQLLKASKLNTPESSDQYSPPATLERIKELGLNHLLDCPIHTWRATSGTELIHKEPDVKELNRIMANWLLMDEKQKAISDAKSKELFGVDNQTHYNQLLPLYTSAKEEAKGIPSRKIMHPPNTGLSEGELIDYVIQQHDAHRAGKHFDLRAGKKGLGLHSFVSRRDVLENLEPGGIAELHPQPTHSFKYKDFEGEIGPPGVYGAGTVKTHSKGKVLLTKVTPDAIHFTTADNRPENRYALIKNNDRWLLARPHNISATGVKKEHYNSIKPEGLQSFIKTLKENDIVQPKVDGALIQLLLRKQKPELLSHRSSKETGNPIVHTERFFGGRPEIPELKKYKDSILLGEVFGMRKGRAVPMQELGGILNSTIANSLERQKNQDVSLKTMLFDIARLKGETVKQPYSERRKLLEEIYQHLPKDKFMLPEEVTGQAAVRELLSRIQRGKHPLTQEGLVVHHEEGKPTKLKLTDEHDVHIQDIFPAAKDSKYHRRGVGGFTYSMSPKGPVVGRVGSGLSDQLRQDMYQHPEDYIGRIARVRAQEQYGKTQALRHPVLLDIHHDY